MATSDVPVYPPAEKLRAELREISDSVLGYFQEVSDTLERCSGYRRYNDVLTEENKTKAQQLRQRLAQFGIDLLTAVKSSPVLEQTDETIFRRLIRGMSAAISLKIYEYHEAYVVSDEDQFRGLMPASQDERDADLMSCERQFLSYVEEIEEKLDLIAPDPANLASAIVASQTPSVRKYRPNTAFIMMQIDEENGDLEDVKNTIKDTFKEFGIVAVRSDDIEHSDVDAENSE